MKDLVVYVRDKGFDAWFENKRNEKIEKSGEIKVRFDKKRSLAHVTGEFLVDSDVKFEAYLMYNILKGEKSE